MKHVRPDGKQWNNFVRTYLSFDGENNVNADFTKITKVAGVAYFEFLRASWVCMKDYITEQDFCKVNGNVPISFFEKNVRDHEVTKIMESEVIIKEYPT